MNDWASAIAKTALGFLATVVAALGGLLWRDSRQIALNGRQIASNTRDIEALMRALDKEIALRSQRNEENDEENDREHARLKESLAAVAQLAAVADAKREVTEHDGLSQWQKIDQFGDRMSHIEVEIGKLATKVDQLFSSSERFDRRRNERGE